ncbi:hypothetical protein ACIBG7_16755 [Nonomuraea sp. NPDC050328]|uniref:hypothetical protein n=1 Tax=Nonomuraea sp. NPDC050328 TaxID=3364361 RepID=UPI0037AABC55
MSETPKLPSPAPAKEYLPSEVSTARVIMFVQVGFGLLALAFVLPTLLSAGVGLELLMLLPALLGLLLLLFAALRFRSRKRWARYVALAAEGFSVLTWIYELIELDGGQNGIGNLFSLGFPLIVVILLSRTPAARWFDR